MHKSERLLVLYMCVVFVLSVAYCKLLFTVDHWNACLPDEIKLKTIVGISIEECVVECGKRRSCKNVGYIQNARLCHIYTDRASFVTEVGRCILVNRINIDSSLILENCACSEGQVCMAGSCEYKECATISFTNGGFFGNKRTVGSRKSIYCDPGYAEINGHVAVTCEESGNWSYIPTCISTIVCGNITVANGNVIGQDDGVGAVRTIVCDTGFEEQMGETVIQCEITGYWNYTPVCSQIIVCSDISISNGGLIGTGLEVGAVRTIVCDIGHEEQSDQSTIHCDSTGNWNYIPTCSLIPDNNNGGSSDSDD